MIEDVGISTEQSVAVVLEVARHLHQWSTLGRQRNLLVPAIRDLRLERGGGVSWHGGHALPGRAVIPALGALLTALLRHSGARTAVPAGLMYILVRSTHDPSLAPFVGLEELIAALGRFAPISTAAALDALLARYTIARAELPALDGKSSVSDVRRLRRAGGVALATIATDTGIPLSLLRELEWGVYVNWPDAHADPSIRAYASRAGLDPDLTLSVIARERAESERVPAAVRRPARRVSFKAVPLPERVLPWAAIVALAVGALFVGAGDRRPGLPVSMPPAHTSIAQPAAATVAEERATPPATPPVVQPVPQSLPATPKPERLVKPSRVTNKSSSSAARPIQQVTRTSHRTMWVALARALKGDGKYTVQPFPKAAQGQ